MELTILKLSWNCRLGLKGIDEAVVPDSQVFVLRNDTVTCASEGLRL